MSVYFFMPEDCQKALHAARESLQKSKRITVGMASLLKQLSNEVESHIRAGDWSTATKFSYYCHEIAKLHNSHEWYDLFLEVRKMRDFIDITLEEQNVKSREEKRKQKAPRHNGRY